MISNCLSMELGCSDHPQTPKDPILPTRIPFSCGPWYKRHQGWRPAVFVPQKGCFPTPDCPPRGGVLTPTVHRGNQRTASFSWVPCLLSASRRKGGSEGPGREERADPPKTQPGVTLGKESCEVPGKGGLWVPDVTLPNSPLPLLFSSPQRFCT